MRLPWAASGLHLDLGNSNTSDLLADFIISQEENKEFMILDGGASNVIALDQWKQNIFT
jgi:hypothetical protein